MTCEVAVMNKYAVVIASDSAVTTSDQNGVERYSKGGNKIFQLSHFEPVGVMLFGSATLNGVPWEIIIKAFRDHIGRQSHPKLEGYSKAFFDFVKSAHHIFPANDIDRNYADLLAASAAQLLREAIAQHAIISDTTQTDADRIAAWNIYLDEKNAALDAEPIHPLISNVEYQQALSNPEIPPYIPKYLQDNMLDKIIDMGRWFNCACKNFFKHSDGIQNATGIVFSGFGTEQYFPEVIAYDGVGFVKNHLVYTGIKDKSCQIGHDVPSGIFQFAMTSSIDAFTTGIDGSLFGLVQNEYKDHVRSIVQSLFNSTNTPIPADLEVQIQLSSDSFANQWVPKIYDLHYYPMKRVIASLPLEELVHLAETLIVLQSLKERITSPKQSVGGPIDVAVITKSEGLVWIKRKHFFDSEKNIRYVMRQKAIYN
jgi:hypothetical protein